MAKVIGPIASTDVRGQVGKTVTFQGKKGMHIAHKYDYPRRPDTTAQKDQKGVIRWLGFLWKRIHPATYDTAAKGKVTTAYGEFIKGEQKRPYIYINDSGNDRIQKRLKLDLSYITKAPLISGWISPTGHTDPDAKWTAESQAYDGNLEDQNGAKIWNADINHYLELNRSAVTCNKIRIRIHEYDWETDIIYDANIVLDVYYSDAWHNIHTGTITKQQWNEIPIDSTQEITAARVKHTSYTTADSEILLVEFEFWATPEFNTPIGIACDEKYIYISDCYNHRIQKRLKADLGFVAKIGTYGTGDDQFNSPIGIACDEKYIYISDHSNHRIQKRLKADLSFIAKIGTRGTGDDQFDYPRGIACDEKYIYISDHFNHRIQKRLKADLSFIAKIGTYGTGNDQFNNPTGIACDEKYIYISDYNNHRIQKRLKADLSFIAKIGTYGTGNDQFNNPTGIACDEKYIYISDYNNHRIQKRLKADLSFVAKIGTEGTGDDQFKLPRGIACI